MAIFKRKKQESIFRVIRKPVPKPDRPMTSKKGQRGYDRKKEKIKFRKEIDA